MHTTINEMATNIIDGSALEDDEVVVVTGDVDPSAIKIFRNKKF